VLVEKIDVAELDLRPSCSYNVLIVDGACSAGSLFDIVDQNANGLPPESADRPASPASRIPSPVNFLYMGLFLGFKKLRSEFLTYA
jgi:hypothetical protein